MQKIVGWLIAQGIALGNDTPTETQVLEALQKLHTANTGAVTSLGNEKSTLASKLTTLEGQVTALTNDKTGLATKVTTLENSVKTERTGRAAAVVDLVIAQGKMTVAQRDATITSLANAADFDAEARKLADAAKTVKVLTDASGKTLANDLPNSDIRKAHLAAMEKHMQDTGESDPIKAHNAVLAANPALKDAMSKTEEKK